MMLEGECIGVRVLFVKDKRSDHSAGSDFREIMQYLVKIGNVGAVGSAIIRLSSLFFYYDDASLAIFLELFANGRLVEHHRTFKA